MTNEEKANEIMRCNCYLHKGGFSSCKTSEFDGVRMCYKKKQLLEMARWKDEQYAEEKRELLGLVKLLKVNEDNQSIIEDLIGLLQLWI